MFTYIHVLYHACIDKFYSVFIDKKTWSSELSSQFKNNELSDLDLLVPVKTLEGSKTKAAVQRNTGLGGIASGANNLSSTSTGDRKTRATLQWGTDSHSAVRRQGSLPVVRD